MNKKTIIQVVVIAGGFLGTGIVLYNGFNAGSGAGVPIVSTTPLAQEKILPYGESFDYQKIRDLRNQRFQFGAVNYQKVDVDQEVGTSGQELIKPIPKPSSAQQ